MNYLNTLRRLAAELVGPIGNCGKPTNYFLILMTILLANPIAKAVTQVRFATYNVSLYGSSAGEVADRLAAGYNPQARCEAEIIQRVRPDVLLLNEIDYDPESRLAQIFQEKYLAVSQNVSASASGPAEPIRYPYRYLAPVNTGIPSGFDLDRNGKVSSEPGSREYGGDCWGFGQYPGQYGMVLLSKYPIDTESVRTFQKFLWKDMPGALLPDDAQTKTPGDWYAADALEKFRLSSKSHWDLPIQINGRTVHVLASHPTPPIFDGAEDRNGRRNHDEIRFWVDYIAADIASYIYDDCGTYGGLPTGECFVIMGDLNGDPHDGEGTAGISLLLTSPSIAQYLPPESTGGAEQARLQGGVNKNHLGSSRNDTLDGADDGPGNLRLDYVLPSKKLKVVASGVFWPDNTDRLFSLVGVYPFPSSDHRLVWVNVEVE